MWGCRGQSIPDWIDPLMKPPTRIDAAVTLVIVFAFIGLANILFAEQLTYNEGFGYDGLKYGAWAQDFYNNVIVQGLPEYYTQRVLPSFLVHYGTKIVLLLCAGSIDQYFSDKAHVLFAFQIYNLVLLCLSVWVYG